ASAASLPPRLPRLLPAGATVAGRDSHPLKDRAFARRTHKQRKQSSSNLTIVFSKLVTMTGNRGCLLRMLLENCNPLIYRAAMITS
ncbi:MAG: hypothetical protein ACYCQM_15010, partial [Acidithiobacillus sp.]